MESLYIKKILAGDHKAFSFLVSQHQDMGYAVAISIVKNDAKAQDVVQDSFVKVFHNLSTFNQTSKFSSWFYKIVYNTALQELKRSNRQWAVESESVEVFSDISIENSAIESLKTEQLRLIIKTTLKQLPPKEALVLQLYYLNEQSIKEIEDITQFSAANIKVLLHRGRQHFYKAVQQSQNISTFNELDI